MCEVVSKNIALKKPLCSKKTIVFQHVHFLSNCFETKNYHCLLPILSNTDKLTVFHFKSDKIVPLSLLYILSLNYYVCKTKYKLKL